MSITAEQYRQYATVENRIDALREQIRKLQDEESNPVEEFIRDNIKIIRYTFGISQKANIDFINWDDDKKEIEIDLTTGDLIYLNLEFFQKFETYEKNYKEYKAKIQKEEAEKLEKTERAELARLKEKYES